MMEKEVIGGASSSDQKEGGSDFEPDRSTPLDQIPAHGSGPYGRPGTACRSPLREPRYLIV